MRSADTGSKRIRLAIVCTHPIQYYAPVFRALAHSADIDVRVFYTWSQTVQGDIYDPGFGAKFSWDIPLREGYDHVFVENHAKKPGSDHFKGIQNPTLNREIADWRASAVLIYGWNLHSHLRALRFFKGKIPVLFRGDSTLLDARGSLRSIARKLWLRWVYSHVDLALAVGQNNRDYFLWCGVDSKRIRIAPHSVDTERFVNTGGEHDLRANRWRKELGIAEEAVAFLFAAKFTPKKDPLLLLNTFIALGMPEAHLIMVGNGILDSVLRARAVEFKNIHFIDFQNQSDMPSVYRLGDAFVLPSCGPGETWGLALNEAIASGRVVISSTRAGGARDLILKGLTGWEFESGNQEELGRVMRDALARGRRQLLQMGQDAQKTSARWSSTASAEAIAGAVALAAAALT